ncbi:MAG: flagellar biosynthetic protein FliO [Planctomycetota bacterium]|nr:flagellar biosynthetic protein FliO [Planctomycetota bacterium]
MPYSIFISLARFLPRAVGGITTSPRERHKYPAGRLSPEEPGRAGGDPRKAIRPGAGGRRLLLIFPALFLLPPLSSPPAALAGEARPAPIRGESPLDQAIREAEAEAERLGNPPDPVSAGWGLSEILSLAALGLAVILMLWAVRWSRGFGFTRSGSREMRLLDRLAVGRQASLLVIRLRGRDYWLAEHSRGVTLLAELAAADGQRKVGEKPPGTPPLGKENGAEPARPGPPGKAAAEA